MYYQVDKIKKILKDVNDVNEVIQFAKDNPVSKVEVLRYAALKSTNKGYMVKPLLMSGIYSPWEIFKCKFSDIHYNKAALEIIGKYADIYWQSQTEYSDTLLHRTIYFNGEDKETDLIKKMKFFYGKNDNIFEGLKNEFMNDFSIYKTYFALRKVGVSNEYIYEFEKEYYHILKGTDARQVFIYNPGLSGETNIQLVMYKVNEKNKWSAFEKIASENPSLFRRLIEDYVRVNVVKRGIVKYSREEIVERYGNKSKDEIPTPIYEYIEGLKEAEKKREERKEESGKERETQKRSWYKYGEFIVLFRVGELTPTCAEDYQLLLNKYLEDGLSIEKFCKKYSIIPESGFSKMLEKFEMIDSTLKQKIENVKQRMSNKYFMSLMSTIDDFNNGKISVEDFINLTLKRKSSWENLKYFLEKINEVDRLEKMTTKLLNYYHARVNSFNMFSTNPEDILKALSHKEIMFILGREKYRDLANNKNISVGEELLPLINIKYKDNPRILSEKFYGRMPGRIRNVLNQLGLRYKKLNDATLTVMLENGQWVEIPEQVIEEAEQFVADRGLYKSTVLVGNVIRAIANGKLNVKDYEKPLRPSYENDDLETQPMPVFRDIKQFLDYVDQETIM